MKSASLFLCVCLLIGLLKIQCDDTIETSSKSDVIELTSDNFDSHLEQKTKDQQWFVEFFAPWCGHCKHLAPIYEQVATTLKANDINKINVAKVDCTKSKDLCSRFGVQGYPTIKFIHVPSLTKNVEDNTENNKETRKVYEYDQPRTLNDFVKYSSGEWNKGKGNRFPQKGESMSSSSLSPLTYFFTFITEHPAYGIIGILVVVGLFVACIVLVLDSLKDETVEGGEGQGDADGDGDDSESESGEGKGKGKGKSKGQEENGNQAKQDRHGKPDHMAAFRALSAANNSNNANNNNNNNTSNTNNNASTGASEKKGKSSKGKKQT